MLRQHWWLVVLSEFNFKIQYIPGEINKYTDALSRIYSDKPKGVVHAESELVDEGEDVSLSSSPRIRPIYIEAYLLGVVNATMRRSSQLADKPV